MGVFGVSFVGVFFFFFWVGVGFVWLLVLFCFVFLTNGWSHQPPRRMGAVFHNHPARSGGQNAAGGRLECTKSSSFGPVPACWSRQRGQRGQGQTPFWKAPWHGGAFGVGSRPCARRPNSSLLFSPQGVRRLRGGETPCAGEGLGAGSPLPGCCIGIADLLFFSAVVLNKREGFEGSRPCWLPQPHPSSGTDRSPAPADLPPPGVVLGCCPPQAGEKQWGAGEDMPPGLFGSVCIETSWRLRGARAGAAPAQGSWGPPPRLPWGQAEALSAVTSFRGARCHGRELPLDPGTRPLTAQGGCPAGRCWCQGAAVHGCGAPRPPPWCGTVKGLGWCSAAAGKSRAERKRKTMAAGTHGPPRDTPSQLPPAGTLQPTARRVCRETTAATTASAVARPSARTSGQKVRASTDAESSAATASSSHCSQAAGISHRTCGDSGPSPRRVPSPKSRGPPCPRTHRGGDVGGEGVAVDADSLQEAVGTGPVALPPPQEPPQRQRHQPGVAVDEGGSDGDWGWWGRKEGVRARLGSP